MAVHLSRRFLAECSSLIRNLSSAAGEVEAVSGGGGGKIYKRLSKLGGTGKTVAQTLNDYHREGNLLWKDQLDGCIKELRKYGKYHHALQILEWMESRGADLSHKDLGVRMSLISSVQGMDAAETYFNGLSLPEKNVFTYEALLSCYCKGKMEGKALALFAKMDKKGLVSSLAFSDIMTLYLSLGQPEKVPTLVQEMKGRNFRLHRFSFFIWMHSLSHLNDIVGVEKVFEEMMRNYTMKHDWKTYCNLASIYVKAGLHEKADSALKKLEKEFQPLKVDALRHMISLYAGISRLNEVYRVWNILKSSVQMTTNLSYLAMLQALAKLKDIDGLKKCFEEWESSCQCYDTRLASTAVSAYLKFGKIKEAESVFQKAIKRSSGPFFGIWYLFAVFYMENRQMDLAMRYMVASISEAEKEKSTHRPSPETIENFMKYFEEEKDIDGAEKLFKSLKKINCLDSKTYCLLLRTYIAANETEPKMRMRIEEDSIKLDSELENLLKRVCAE